MNIENINKKEMMVSFLRNISHIADKEYQQRIWIKGKGPECDDFDETADFFLEEAGIILKNYKKFDVTDEQYRIALKLQKKLDEFSDDHSYEPEFIDSPEWLEIVEMAKEVLKAFNWKAPVGGKKT